MHSSTGKKYRSSMIKNFGKKVADMTFSGSGKIVGDLKKRKTRTESVKSKISY